VGHARVARARVGHARVGHARVGHARVVDLCRVRGYAVECARRLAKYRCPDGDLCLVDAQSQGLVHAESQSCSSRACGRIGCVEIDCHRELVAVRLRAVKGEEGR
jgi:hypothetical protein